MSHTRYKKQQLNKEQKLKYVYQGNKQLSRIRTDTNTCHRATEYNYVHKHTHITQ